MTEIREKFELGSVLEESFETFNQLVKDHHPELKPYEIGTVESIGYGIARVTGLSGVQSEEIIQFPGNLVGMAFNLDPDGVGVILLGKSDHLVAGAEVRRTRRVLDVPVGESVLGRVLDPTGQALDGKGALDIYERLPVERPASPIMVRAPVTVPLQTGIKSIDALIPIGRGQRELILGDRQTGKSAIALDTIINQRDTGVVSVYCAIGQRSSAVASFVAELNKYNALDNTVVIVSSGEDPPGLKFIAPYAATSIAEYFMEHGRDALVIYDDLTRHAWAYRELSLLLRRPPGREAYPGDIFYIHSRLLERSTHLRPEHGGGSLTALPIIETEAQNVSAYIPTNLISITDGQIYLTPDLYAKGIMPAVDVGKSVSRVGGKAQLSAYRAVAGDLRLSYSQFEELENFARFGTRLDELTYRTIERGRRIREVFKQVQFKPIPVAEQIAVLLTAITGLFDDLPLEKVGAAEVALRSALVEQRPDICEGIQAGDPLPDEDRKAILDLAKTVIDAMKAEYAEAEVGAA